jgi:hypothetical protein
MGFLSQPITIIPIQPVRKINDIKVNVVIQENTNDTLTITKQPIQMGASITDHSYQEPTTLSMSMYFNDNSLENLFSANTLSNPVATLANTNGLQKIYNSLQTLQTSRMPFTVITPKRIYTTMLMSALALTTDKATENCLKIDCTFQQIIIVPVSTVSVPRIRQKNPGSTGATQNAGQKSSILYSGSQAIASVIPK